MASGDLLAGVPQLENLREFKLTFDQCVQDTGRDLELVIQRHSRVIIEQVLSTLQETVAEVPYPGLLRIWQYAHAIVRHCNHQLATRFADLDQETF